MKKTPVKTNITPAKTHSGGATPAKTAMSPKTAQSSEPAPKKRTNIFVFFREVRAESKKITWTSMKETWITSVMVLIMVVVATIFFGIVDFSLGAVASLLLKR